MSRTRVIIADDDRHLLTLLDAQVKAAGYECYTCNNGRSALLLAARKRPAILLLDWEMPGLTGVEVCQAIRARGWSSSVYAILVTARSDPAQMAEGIEKGADDYIIKPTHAGMLIARIRAGERVLQLLTEVQDKEQRLHAVLEAGNDAIVTINAAGTITLVNPAATNMFVGSEASLVGESIYRFVPPAYHDRYRNLIAECTACDNTGRSTGRTSELKMFRTDGAVFPAEISAASGRCGRDRLVVCVIRDVTDRAVREEGRKRLAHAMEAVAEGIVLTDVDGRIIQANPAYCRITGYEREELLGGNPSMVKSGEHHQDFYEQLWRTIRSGKTWGGRVVNKRKDGSLYIAELTIAPFVNEDGEVSGYVGVQRDVTKQVEHERELCSARAEAEAALAKLQQVNAQLLQADKMASIGHLAAGVAHEINNPIGFITSNLNSLATYASDLNRVLEAYEGLLEECRKIGVATKQVAELSQLCEETDLEYVLADLSDLISESTEGTMRVRKIVADLKDFSHVDSTDTDDVDINELMDKTISVAWNELKYKAEVVREYGELPLVCCFGGRVGQVFLNLLVNAAQAIEEHGVITIRTGREDQLVFVEISDTGCGISQENLSRIFDPFFTTKEVGKGTGLGLHLSLSIAEVHGGRLTCRSTVGEGTTFRLTLPIAGPPNVQENSGERVKQSS